MINKKGQGMSTSTIILLVLGMIVLVVLALGFFMGWQKLGSYLSSNNVDSIVSECNSACASGSVYNFCSAQKTLTDDQKVKTKASCNVFANVAGFQKYGVASCPSITCSLPCASIQINGKNGVISTSGSSGKYDVSFMAKDLSQGQICIIQ